MSSAGSTGGSGILQEIEQVGENIFEGAEQAVENVVGGLGGGVTATVSDAVPVIQGAISSLEAGLLADLTTPGGTKNTGTTIASVINSTLPQLAGIAIKDLLTAFASAL